MPHEKSGPGALAGATEATGKITGRRFSPSTDRDQAATRGLSRRTRSCHRSRRHSIEFAEISHAALAVLPRLLARWLPGGRIEGAEYVALNPLRADHRPGSFKVNLVTGRWADFAVAEARGGDVVSLGAYLGGIGQREAAERLAAMLGTGGRYAR
jgi:hypothetical protein